MRRDAALVGHEGFDPAWAGGASPVRVVRYVYWKTGDVANIVIKDEGVAPPEDADRYNWYRSLACYYTTSGQLWQVLWDRWLLDGEGRVNVHQKLAAREFRYDTPRARYMSRAVDPETWQPFEPADPNAAISHGEWTDYLGDQPWGDFSVSTPRVAGEPQPPVTGAVRRYLPGFGVQAVETIATSGPNRVTYFHGDLIRSNWATSETGEVAETTTAYTAFGENLAGTPGGPGGLDPETRYGFAGGWGYESGLITLDGAPGTAPITLQHLGARWYQPEIGRFVQRDPIGIQAGQNTYLYCGAYPLTGVDPSGLLSDGHMIVRALGILSTMAGGIIAIAGAPITGGVTSVVGAALWGHEDLIAFAICIKNTIDWDSRGYYSGPATPNLWPVQKRGGGGGLTISGTPPISMFPPRVIEVIPRE